MLSGVDAIYWINLDRSKGRRRNMETLFENELFSELKGKNAIKRVEAIDGSGEREVEVRERLSGHMRSLPSTAEREARGIHITYKEIACTLSHLTAIRRFAEEGRPGQFAIIMEDDVTLDFQKYWHCLPFKNMREMMAMCPDPTWEIIQLSFITGKTNLFDGYNMFAKNDMKTMIPGAAAYCISHDGADKIVKQFIKNGRNALFEVNSMYYHADHLLFSLLNTYVCRYALFTYPQDNVSLLHSDHLQHHNDSYQLRLQDLQKLCRKKKADCTDSHDTQIPLHIWETWHTKELPPSMRNTVDFVRRQNPEFTFHLCDINDCRTFLQSHFEPDVLLAYDELVPLAYKADLWRYCVLYIHGGIYMDIKFIPLVKLTQFTKKEWFVLERPFITGHHDNVLQKKVLQTNIATQIDPLLWPDKKIGICNGFIVSLPGNKILKDCIDRIVKHTQTHYYGRGCLDVTGPALLGSCYFDYYPDDLSTFVYHYSLDGKQIVNKNGDTMLKFDKNYRKEQAATQTVPPYFELYEKKQIFRSTNKNRTHGWYTALCVVSFVCCLALLFNDIDFSFVALVKSKFHWLFVLFVCGFMVNVVYISYLFSYKS